MAGCGHSHKEKRGWLKVETLKQGSQKDAAQAGALTYAGNLSGGEVWGSSHV